MLRHYLTVAIRIFRRQKLYSAINVVGLSTGIAICTLIFLFIQNELTFDRFHDNADRIVRVNKVSFNQDGSVDRESVWQPYPFAEALVEDHPDVLATTRLFEETVFLRTSSEPIEATVLFADSTFFRLFSFDLLEGRADRVLRHPNAIVLTETAARRQFGTTDVVGESVDIRFEDSYLTVPVTGLVADPPANSSIQFDYLVPFHALPHRYEWISRRPTMWNASSWPTFALLHPEAQLDNAQQVVQSLRQKYYPDELERYQTEWNWEADFSPNTYRMQPLLDIHLDPSVQGGLVPPSNPQYSFILGAIATLILLLACINYTTLAIARSARRASEIGLRKSVGADRKQILSQFGGEALVFGIIGTAGSVLLSYGLLPVFNTLSGNQLELNFVSNPVLPVAVVALGIFASILAGAYPALLLSRQSPLPMLRGTSSAGGSARLSRVLVVTQFTLSIGLIAATLLMQKQMNFVQQKDLGFEEEGVLVIELNELPPERVLNHFRRELTPRPEFQEISAVSLSFTKGWSREGWDYRGESKSSYVYHAESNYAELMDFEFIAGRNYDPRLATDSTDALIVNEAFAEEFGWTPREALGQTIYGFYDEPQIVGVFRNVNFRSLHREVEPMAVTMSPDGWIGNILVRADMSRPTEVVDLVKAAWEDVAAEVPLSYSFLDEDMAAQYRNEERWSRIVSYSSGLAILIACLGLFGLATLSVSNRTKEIGIRKVLGASAAGIFGLLTKDYGLLIGIALLLSAPLTYYGIGSWLENFAYRIDIGILPFATAAVIAALIALVSISYQAIQASRANPVESLRYE